MLVYTSLIYWSLLIIVTPNNNDDFVECDMKENMKIDTEKNLLNFDIYFFE